MNKLDRKYRLRTSDFDRYHKILPATLLDMFQDMAGEHADYIGVGYGKMAKNNMFWALLRVRYEIIEAPKLYTDISASTWPHEPRKTFFVRDYVISDDSGKQLVIGSSQWGLLDLTTRRIVPPRNVIFEIDEYYPRHNFEDNMQKIRDFEITEDMKPYEVLSEFTDIDINGHVNNIKYANYIVNALSLPEDEVIKAFQIDYRKEIMQGQKIYIYHVRNEDIISCKGCNAEGQIMFAAEIKLSKK